MCELPTTIKQTAPLKSIIKVSTIFQKINYSTSNISQLSLLLSILLLAIGACKNGSKNNYKTVNRHFKTIEYSKQFGILESDNDLQIIHIEGNDTQWSYTFEKGNKAPKVVVLSTVFAGFLELLNQQSNIIGVENFNFYSDSILLNQFKTKSTLEIGEESQLLLEKVLSIKPDIIICNSPSFIKSAHGQRLESSGVKVIYCDNFKEAHPLARAEWIKFFGAITGQLEKADSVFDIIKTNYNAIAKKAEQHRSELKANGKEVPSILAEAMFGDTWFVPGGKSYTAQLIQDAGGHYCFSELQPLFTYPKSLEDVLQSAREADIWIHISQFKTRDDLLQQDKRYGLFKAFENHQLFNNNKQENPKGGNAFWEIGVGRPDLILNDLYQIFKDPRLNTDSLTYYSKIL